MRERFILAATLLILSACSSAPPAENAKSGPALDKIQGKAQVLVQGFGSADASLSQGQPVVYIWEGVRRYTLYFRAPTNVVPGKEYVVEGVNAQRVIDEIGDPDVSTNGYPLRSSCDRVVRMAWSGLPFDEADGRVTALRARVKRYPARPVFLVTHMDPAPAEESAAPTKADANAKEVSVAADKQRAALISGKTELIAPLWEGAGGTVRCPVVVDTEGKIAELGTGMQLCEAVPWSEFRYHPLVQAGHAVKVRTEVEVCFKPRAA